VPVTLSCQHCKGDFRAAASSVGRRKFCSYVCRQAATGRQFANRTHKAWASAPATKTCGQCGSAFSPNAGELVGKYLQRRFCNNSCASTWSIWNGTHPPDVNEDRRRKSRGGKHAAWARTVISRDGAKCVDCGAHGVEVQAHHVKSYRTHPKLRYETSNGVTLCAPCHWQEHKKPRDNRVNCWEAPPVKPMTEGNQQPSVKGNLVEGSTTSGRSYRRWEGNCGFCGAFLSKRLSDTVGKANLLCDRSCSAKHRVRHSTALPMRPMVAKVCKNCSCGFEVPDWRKDTASYCSQSCRTSHRNKIANPMSHGSNASTSALHRP
jgi:5-methylcytosine-specific restriction endonuclease McrA